MASVEDSERVVHELFQEVAASGISVGAKAAIYLRLAEAYAWLVTPSNSHGGTVEVSGGS